MSNRRYYDILGVRPNALQDEIKTSYKRLAKTCHPDLFPDNLEKENEFKRLSEAYEVLSDPEKRRSYDTDGFIGKEDELIRQAEEEFVSLFGQVFDAIPVEKLPTFDIKILMIQGINESVSSVQNSLIMKEKGIAKLQIALQRFKSKGAKNLIANSLKQKIQEAYSSIEMDYKKLKVLSIIREISQDYDYDYTTNFGPNVAVRPKHTYTFGA